jgi:integrase
MDTCIAIVNNYLRALKSKPSWRNYCNLTQQYFHGWQQHPTFKQVHQWHQSLAHTPHHANKGLALLKAAYAWAIRCGEYQGPNPAQGVKPHKTFSRERVVAVLPVLQPKLSASLTLALNTGARASELLGARWEDINLTTGLWRQPHTKNGNPHRTWLPTQSRNAIAPLSSDSEYVFSYEDASWSLNSLENAWWKVRADLDLEDVRLHDFRRTLATHLYVATRDEYLVKRCLNHVNTSITAIYIRISDEQVAEALQAQADRWWG